MPQKIPTKAERPLVKNFVKEAAKIKINKQDAKKQYIPGVYVQHHPSQCDLELNSRPIHLKLNSATEGKEMLKLVTPENVRHLLVPSEDGNVYPTIWHTKELRRIEEAGTTITKEQRQAFWEASEAEKNRLIEECEQRKQMFKDIDRIKAERAAEKAINMSDDEDPTTKLLDRAFVARQEETEEIKKANSIILATKCHVIRDAQISEKNEIKRELREEDLRLEKMMIDGRDKAILQDDNERARMSDMKAKNAEDIKKQLQDREMLKLMQAERVEEEAKAMAKFTQALKEENENREKMRREQMQLRRGELQKSNQLSEFFKSIAFEEQRIAEMKAQEYMRDKHAREKQLLHEKKLAQEHKQREADRMLANQTKLLMTKSEQGEMELRRFQEEKERVFRRQEKEAALRKQKQLKELEAARNSQMEEVKRRRAIELEQEELEFQQSVNKLKSAGQLEKELQEKRMKNMEKYRSDIINQINQKEKLRREEQELNKQELVAQIEKEKERNKNIQSVINAKLESMRAANIPEKFIKDVQRQLTLSTTKLNH